MNARWTITLIFLLALGAIFWDSYPAERGTLLGMLLALGLAGLVLAALITRNSELLTRPDLRPVFRQDGVNRDHLLLKRLPDGTYHFAARLGIRNDGSRALLANEGFWNIHFIGFPEALRIDGKYERLSPAHIREQISLPVYPGTSTDCSLYITGEVPADSVPMMRIYCHFCTHHGEYPRTAVQNPQTGLVSFEHMFSIPVNFS